MSSRNAIDVFDPEVARRHSQAELRSKMGGPVNFQPGRIDPSITASVQKKILDALAKEGAKLRAREEERRKRDPTYREDAIDLSTENLKAYDKYVNYYEKLEVDEFASALVRPWFRAHTAHAVSTDRTRHCQCARSLRMAAYPLRGRSSRRRT